MRARAATPLAALGAIAACAAALAQQTAPEDAVTVTGTRVARPSLEVPASIDRVQAEDIRFARPMVNLSESLPRVPGIVVQNRQNYAQDLQVSSRGFGSRATFGIRGIRLYADGIPASMPDGQGQAANFDLGSAERIEVLRGPFSAMYGNASGGVINVFTESGARYGEGSSAAGADLSLGSYDTWRAGVTAGSRSGRADWIASVSSFHTDGYRQHAAADRTQGNARLNLGLADRTALTLVANILDSPEVQDPLGLTRAQMDADPRQAGAVANLFNTRKSVRQNQLGGTLSHDLGGTQLSATAYGGHRVVRQYLGLRGATPNTTSGGVVDLDRDYAGLALRAAREFELGPGPLLVSAGYEYETMDERRKGFVNEFGDLGALRRDEDDDVASSSLYAQAEWRIAERWIALAGVRVTRVAFRSRDHYIVPGTPSNPDDSGSKKYDETSPVLGLLYRVTPLVSLYASYGEGFETPTFSELAYRPGGGTGLNFALDASTSRNLEAGIKAFVTPQARVNLAVFDIEAKDEIVVDTNVNGRTTFKNAPGTRRTGFELGTDATLPLGFEAVLAWTQLKATFTDAFTTGTPAVTIPTGNSLPGVPRSFFYGELGWRHAPSGFRAALEYVSKSKVYVNDANSEAADAYKVFDLAAGFTQQGRNWRLSEYLRADNLTSRKYAGSVIVNEANGRYYEPSPTRNYMAGISAKLGF
jgi:iron complex outermembrane receptor protein